VVWIEALQARRFKLQLARLRLQAVEKWAAIIARQGRQFRSILRPAFGKPPVRNRVAQLLGRGGHHKVALLQELLPRDPCRKICGFKVTLAPVQLSGSLREASCHTKAHRKFEKDLKVRLRLA